MGEVGVGLCRARQEGALGGLLVGIGTAAVPPHHAAHHPARRRQHARRCHVLLHRIEHAGGAAGGLLATIGRRLIKLERLHRGIGAERGFELRESLFLNALDQLHTALVGLGRRGRRANGPLLHRGLGWGLGRHRGRFGRRRRRRDVIRPNRAHRSHCRRLDRRGFRCLGRPGRVRRLPLEERVGDTEDRERDEAADHQQRHAIQPPHALPLLRSRQKVGRLLRIGREAKIVVLVGHCPASRTMNGPDATTPPSAVRV